MTDQELNDMAAERVMGWVRVTGAGVGDFWLDEPQGIYQTVRSRDSWTPAVDLHDAFALLKKLDVQFTISGCGEVDLYPIDHAGIKVLAAGKEPADFARAIMLACFALIGSPDLW